MKKNKYVLIAIAFVTLSLRVYSQDDKDTQKYRLILSELTNSRCDYMICDCDESYVNQIIEHDSLKKSKYNSYILPYPLSPIDLGVIYRYLCSECQDRRTLANRAFYHSDVGILQFILDSIISLSYGDSSMNSKVQEKQKCYWIAKEYRETYEDNIFLTRSYDMLSITSTVVPRCLVWNVRSQIIDIKNAGLILIYNYLVCRNPYRCNIEVPLLQYSWLNIFTLKDIQHWLSENWGTAEEMRKKYQENPLPMYKVTR
ncbi:MAG: hypothetical protein IPK11_13385 [Ignavibacteria bacterium]|jgi:hypothetical protein|nr:hypothetical protein [Ignavibacteria bacterium]